MARFTEIPYLGPRMADENRNEEIDTVEERVDSDQKKGQVVWSVPLYGAEDSQYQQKNGELGEEECETIYYVAIIRDLQVGMMSYGDSSVSNPEDLRGNCIVLALQ